LQHPAEQAGVDEAIELLRADAGAWYAAARLTRRLAGQGRIDELIGEIAAGTRTAADALQRITGQGNGPSPSPPV
jgi:predicted nucleic acid-binding protein